jgi:hypothetical protein
MSCIPAKPNSRAFSISTSRAHHDARTKENNHYDDSHVNHVKELEAVPGEHVAMFYGLQVLEGHEHTVKNGELRAVVNESKAWMPTTRILTSSSSSSSKYPTRKKYRKRRKRAENERRVLVTFIPPLHHALSIMNGLAANRNNSKCPWNKYLRLCNESKI